MMYRVTVNIGIDIDENRGKIMEEHFFHSKENAKKFLNKNRKAHNEYLNEMFQTCEEDKGYIIDYPNYYSYFDETNDYEIIIEPTEDNGEHVFEDE